MTEALQNISVILIETRSEGNMGATARAMKNMGLSRLKLVNPLHAPDQLARRRAGKAADLLEQARICSSLDEALRDEQLVIGTTSGRERDPGLVRTTPRQIAPTIRRRAREQSVALLFGSERAGLDDACLARCQHLVSIPAHPESPVLNLSHAVAVVAYEILAADFPAQAPEQLASDEEREQMYEHIQRVLVEIGFLSAGHPEPIMRAIRHFLGRADLSPRDVQIVRGIMSQMEWYAGEGRHHPAGSVRKP